MKFVIALVSRRLKWSQQNFAHTKTAELSWYVQILLWIDWYEEKYANS